MSKIFKHATGHFTDENTVIMGILNVTPDSFYDGGNYFSADSAIKRADEMIEQGADIIDIGAMSTRPGSKKITSAEEIERLKPVLKKICEKCVVSVDTIYPETARFCLENGASVINDVSGIFNPNIAELVKKYSAGWIVTHTMNKNAESDVEYEDGVINSVADFFDEVCGKCFEFGIDKEYLCLDPGFGFCKNTKQNLEILGSGKILNNREHFVLSALSRKRFIGDVNDTEKEDRLIGTITADVIAVMNGVNMVRVHDIKEAVQSLKLVNEFRRINNG